MFDDIGRLIAQTAHLVGLCLIIWGIMSALQALERGDMFSGMFKAALRAVLGSVLMKL